MQQFEGSNHNFRIVSAACIGVLTVFGMSWRAVILQVGLILPILKTHQFRFEKLILSGSGGGVTNALNAITICFGYRGLIFWM